MADDRTAHPPRRADAEQRPGGRHHRAEAKSIALIRGVQYRAEAVLLSGEEAEAARARYCKRFPIAGAMKASVWRLDLHEVKMTDNTLGFGKKLHWARSIL